MPDEAAIETLRRLSPAEIETKIVEADRLVTVEEILEAAGAAVLDFGHKHNGELIRDVPLDYLAWTDKEANQVDQRVLRNVRDFLHGRAEQKPRAQPRPQPSYQSRNQRRKQNKKARKAQTPGNAPDPAHDLAGISFAWEGNAPPQPPPAPAASKPTLLPLSRLILDDDIQARCNTDENTVAEYAELLADSGDPFPPVLVIYDGECYWLTDGFHREEAYRRAGRDSIPAEVRQGTKRDAILRAAGANITHGLRRTNSDKRQAVMMLLCDEEWKQWSDRRIAVHCGVSNHFVGVVRRELSPPSVIRSQMADPSSAPQVRIVERGGKTYTMDVSGLHAEDEEEIPEEQAEPQNDDAQEEVRNLNERQDALLAEQRELNRRAQDMLDRLPPAKAEAGAEEHEPEHFNGILEAGFLHKWLLARREKLPQEYQTSFSNVVRNVLETIDAVDKATAEVSATSEQPTPWLRKWSDLRYAAGKLEHEVAMLKKYARCPVPERDPKLLAARVALLREIANEIEQQIIGSK